MPLIDVNYPPECYSQDTLQNRLLILADFDKDTTYWPPIEYWVNQEDSLAPDFSPVHLWSDQGDLRLVQIHRYCTCNYLAPQLSFFYLVVDSVNRDSVSVLWYYPREPKYLYKDPFFDKEENKEILESFRASYNNFDLRTNLVEVANEIDLLEIPIRTDRINYLREKLRANPNLQVDIKRSSRLFFSFENKGSL